MNATPREQLPTEEERNRVRAAAECETMDLSHITVGLKPPLAICEIQ